MSCFEGLVVYILEYILKTLQYMFVKIFTGRPHFTVYNLSVYQPKSNFSKVVDFLQLIVRHVGVKLDSFEQFISSTWPLMVKIF
jgi:hypothetical protein